MSHNRTMRSRAASTLALLFFASSYRCMASCTGKSNKVPPSASSPVGFRQACYSTALYRKTRWFLGGLAPEILTNVVGAIKPASPFFSGRKENDGSETTSRIIERIHTYRNNDGEEAAPIAVVTGATGGIGTEICRGLIQKGYHVIVAARNSEKGAALVEKLQQEVSEASVATYIPLQAGCPKSALHFASALGEKSCAVLINNAAVMQHVTKSQTIQTNLIGPSILTMALLPALRRYYDNNNPNNNEGRGDKQDATTNRRFPVVVNVGSSSHLRADRVDPLLLERDDGNSDLDLDLEAYGQSKLGLMQFSTLLRNNPSISSWLSVMDAHPGIVWTPMLQGAWGPTLAKKLEETGVYKLFFKTPEAGAATIISAAERQPQHHHQRQQQTYFVNCSPGGYASPESRDVMAANEIWRTIIQATAEKVNPNQCNELIMPITSTVHDD